MSDSFAGERTRVEIESAAKTYAGGVRALLPTSLVVEPGEVLALIGPSGCGKTTLLRVIAGLVDPDPGGVVRFGAEDVTRKPIETRGVGMVFQHYALFPQMSVEQNIGYGLRVRGVAEAERKRRVGELVDLVRLGGLEARRPGELSGGQKQRVALARAVALHPRVLLLDEPLTALDAKLKEALRDELAQLLRRLGITAIHVTHDQHEAMAIADRIAVMQAGAVVQVGDAESLYRDPRHAFVASFLGRVNTLMRSDAEAAGNVVRVGGNALAVAPGLGGSKTLFVRPEDIVLAPADGSAAMACLVARRVFLGDRVQLHIETPDQGTLVADAPRDVAWLQGDRCGLHIEASRFMSGGDATP